MVLLAAALRLADLAARPMHGDEAVHAVKLDMLWTTGRYVYDPFEYHGPTLYYFTLPLLWLAGVDGAADLNEALLRLTPVVFGVATVALAGLMADGLGRRAALLGALFCAISPAMTYYSRYYVQEMLLTFFCSGLLACAWRYRVSGRWRWAVAAGALAGLAHASKETCVIAFAALGLAGVIVWRRPGRLRGSQPQVPRRQAPAWLLGGMIALAVSVLCFSCVFTNLRGPLDSVLTYQVYLDRAGGAGIHDHPWWYYTWLLGYVRYAPGPAWSEAAILLLAAIGVGATVARWRRGESVELAALLVIFGLCQFAVYSAIPYKTPWCALGFLHVFTLLAGVGADALWMWTQRSRALHLTAAMAMFFACAHLVTQSQRANSTRFSASNYNPYAYAHPVLGVVRLGEWVERLATVAPEGRDIVVRVISENCWPLPWYLRRLTQVGYWESAPEDCDAAVVICPARDESEVATRLRGAYQVSYYGLRPDVAMAVFVERSLYQRFASSENMPPAKIEANGAAP